MNTRKKSSRSKAKNTKNKKINLVTIDLTEEPFEEFEQIVQAAVSDAVIILEDSINMSSSLAATTSTSETKKEPRKKSKKEKTSKSPEVKSPRMSIGDCAICFEQLASAELGATKCGHVFCLTCLMQTLEFNPACPTCRTKLEGPGAYHPLYLDINRSK